MLKLFFSILFCLLLNNLNGYSQVNNDINWSKNFGIPGLNGNVNSIAERNNDEIVVAGDFTISGNIIVNKIAVWNKKSKSWYSLGGEINGGSIYSVATYKDLIYIGGDFKSISGKSIHSLAVWDNGIWKSISDSISPKDSSAIRTLLIVNDNIYVGGNFTEINGLTSKNLASYSLKNKEWNTFPDNGIEGTVYSIAYGEGSLFVGGDFIFAGDKEAFNVAKFVNNQWEVLDGGTQGIVQALHYSNGNLYVGGGFAAVSSNTPAWGIARWSGKKWFSLGRGIEGSSVSSIVSIGKDIFIAGHFNIAGNDTVNNIAKWDGLKWNKLGDGTSGGVNTIIVTNDSSIFCGGYFSQAGKQYSEHIAMFKNSKWEQISNEFTKGYFQNITNISIGSKNIYVSGSLDDKGEVVRTLASWDGEKWTNLIKEPINGVINSMIVDTSTSIDKIIIVGSFSKINGENINSVGVWDGTKWSAIGNNIIGIVNSITKFENKLYIGGNFKILNQEYKNIATLENEKWVPLSKGSDSIILCVTVNKFGTLYCGGNFKEISDVIANNIAKYENNLFVPLGNGCDSTVRVIHSGVNNELFVGGDFKKAGNVSSFGIASYDGKEWFEMSSELSGKDSKINALTSTNNGLLYAAGSFSSISGIKANSIAKWNRTSWELLGSGVVGSSTSSLSNSTLIQTLATDNNYIYIGGDFSLVGNSPSTAFGIWNAFLTSINKNENLIKPVNSNVILYPNPAKDYLNIKFINKEVVNIDKLIVSNCLGASINKTNYQVNVLTNEFCLNTSSLKPGIYTLRFNDNGEKFSTNFVVIR
ncbi:MAG: T9SS type A sorting domain-containing protein [Chlorobi bacterium]|nr:T9SS type A sorting domain-containing protein [Chlorobiota bacterium]